MLEPHLTSTSQQSLHNKPSYYTKHKVNRKIKPSKSFESESIESTFRVQSNCLTMWQKIQTS